MGVAEIDNERRKITIHSVFFFYGDAANDALSIQVAEDIASHWNDPAATVSINSKLYDIRFKIEGVYSPSLTPSMVIENINPYHNYFRIEDFATGNISFVDDIGSNTGYLLLDNLLNNSTTAAHEYGHTLGLHHPKIMDIRGKGQPAIMYPRGTIVDPHFQYDPAKPPGQPGGTINPFLRKVMQEDIDDLKLDKLKYDRRGRTVLGAFTNLWHEKQLKVEN